MSEPTDRWTAAAGSPAGGGDVVLDVAPQHPGAHGLLRLALRTEADRVVEAEPLVGFMHRGAEKLFEVRDYRQILVLANRHDWLSAFGNEVGVALAVERLLGLTVPERATWLRTCLAELNRALSHLMFLGTDPTRAAAPDGIVRPAFRARERLQRLLEEATGGRVHFMFNRVGGVKEDLPDGWAGRALSVVAAVRADLAEVAGVFSAPAFGARTRGLGRLPAEVVDAYGVSGPLARASGIDIDLRRDDPYLAYGELDVRSVLRTQGDCLARYECLLEQTDVALALAARCVHRLAELPGPVNVRLPKTVRAPEGETYAWTENPLGINGYYLVSRGGATPWRLKLRTASFNNVQALRVVLPGTDVDDVAVVLASMFYVVGDIDK